VPNAGKLGCLSCINVFGLSLGCLLMLDEGMFRSMSVHDGSMPITADCMQRTPSLMPFILLVFEMSGSHAGAV